MGKTGLRELNTAWNVSVFAVFLVHIFPHLDWIFSANAGTYGPQKLQIRTLFAECKIPKTVHYLFIYFIIQNGRFIFVSGNHYRREIICASWIWKVVIFQFHCNIHQVTMFSFSGEGVFTSCFPYGSAWDQLQES